MKLTKINRSTNRIIGRESLDNAPARISDILTPIGKEAEIILTKQDTEEYSVDVDNLEEGFIYLMDGFNMTNMQFENIFENTGISPEDPWGVFYGSGVQPDFSLYDGQFSWDDVEIKRLLIIDLKQIGVNENQTIAVTTPVETEYYSHGNNHIFLNDSIRFRQYRYSAYDRQTDSPDINGWVNSAELFRIESFNSEFHKAQPVYKKSSRFLDPDDYNRIELTKHMIFNPPATLICVIYTPIISDSDKDYIKVKFRYITLDLI